MRALSNIELIEINGGAPIVSNDPAVQGGYHWGYHIGRAIGQTIKDVGQMIDTIGDWIFG